MWLGVGRRLRRPGRTLGPAAATYPGQPLRGAKYLIDASYLTPEKDSVIRIAPPDQPGHSVTLRLPLADSRWGPASHLAVKTSGAGETRTRDQRIMSPYPVFALDSSKPYKHAGSDRAVGSMKPVQNGLLPWDYRASGRRVSRPGSEVKRSMRGVRATHGRQDEDIGRA